VRAPSSVARACVDRTFTFALKLLQLHLAPSTVAAAAAKVKGSLVSFFWAANLFVCVCAISATSKSSRDSFRK
jgi:hypothetical protein